MSLRPWDSVDSFFPGFVYLETQTPLAAGASIAGQTVDLVDLLGVRHSNIYGGGGAFRYDVDPAQPDPRHVLHFTLLTAGAANVPAPGDLVIQSATIDPALGTEGAFSTVATIPHSGPEFFVRRTGSGTVSQLNERMQGVVPIHGRYLLATYHNAEVAQVSFQLGIYLRAIA